METMIKVERAFELIHDQVRSMPPVIVPLKESNGLILAENIEASRDFPAFMQSNMDGYAFAFEEGLTRYRIVGEVAAGQRPTFILQKGETVRIFTGASLPEGADTVVMQEKTAFETGNLLLSDQGLKKGMNTRPVGSEIKQGEIALKKGAALSPAAIGFLAGIGVNRVKAFPRPALGIIVTGNELQQPGNDIVDGQVYESNSYALYAALQQMQIADIKVVHVKDNLETIAGQLQQMINETDMVLVTGGVSVGDYDFTLKAFESCGVTPVFHKIKQKPGKPLLFGMKSEKIVFGLPGNPASVLTCFYEYVRYAIGLLTRQETRLKEFSVPLAHDFKKPEGLTQFLKAYFDGEKVSTHTGQESYRLSSFASANCLAVIPEEMGAVSSGSIIKIHLLP